jgi:hypothetical protein
MNGADTLANIYALLCDVWPMVGIVALVLLWGIVDVWLLHRRH